MERIIDSKFGVIKRWYNGNVYLFEFKENQTEYLGASKSNSFSAAIVVEQIPGQELKQLRDLEMLVGESV